MSCKCKYVKGIKDVNGVKKSKYYSKVGKSRMRRGKHGHYGHIRIERWTLLQGKKSSTCRKVFIRTGLNNVVLPSLFRVVNQWRKFSSVAGGAKLREFPTNLF